MAFVDHLCSPPVPPSTSCLTCGERLASVATHCKRTGCDCVSCLHKQQAKVVAAEDVAPADCSPCCCRCCCRCCGCCCCCCCCCCCRHVWEVLARIASSEVANSLARSKQNLNSSVVADFCPAALFGGALKVAAAAAAAAGALVEVPAAAAPTDPASASSSGSEEGPPANKAHFQPPMSNQLDLSFTTCRPPDHLIMHSTQGQPGSPRVRRELAASSIPASPLSLSTSAATPSCFLASCSATTSCATMRRVCL